MKIIPAIDILDGKCVRLSQGDYGKSKTYSENPVDMAKSFEDAGLRYLHLVDLDGAKAKSIVNHKTLEAIAKSTTLEIDFGGGIKSRNDLETAFSSGAKKITIGSLAVTSPEIAIEWIREFGAHKIIVGADCRDRKIAIQGWQQQSGTDIIDFLQFFKTAGLTQTICTDIAKDGMLQGPAVELYREILSQVDIELIASGGISKLSDIEDVKNIGCAGVIVGKAIYENRISLKQLSDYA
ncbi:1-(5-phosphoribosyl)-5-[(5-phosphoribosylamino)methylideneamino]imidazole-4-carboxamide isomerase [Flavobacterium sp.]|uniref:1-(5-phosphoribosyl)-5-[(5- phosphoribosylamino)methylideneamino]imidazole-4- carboxamide isomerase n=1 Tax=Flavobacterium sp. TaxID=239 RepID=UPI00121EE154|nr:1-(5-phosphoribosyl)-5-[(5-phosphoribosylamino)methylideneamino]imidazole-4-carboxamide isomerase [Flavobacterium sp.]RZJ69515.1 MAG: 1-(5-phosphoribosyl)-5-[(5-phosphoribosylamino)methylideneamino]imidazole-4-carboxamide isomerase [Flavobacterium sp.]